MGGSGENASTKSGEAVQQVEMQWDIEQKKNGQKKWDKRNKSYETSNCNILGW